jgi:hypothetical protein
MDELDLYCLLMRPEEGEGRGRASFNDLPLVGLSQSTNAQQGLS